MRYVWRYVWYNVWYKLFNFYQVHFPKYEDTTICHDGVVRWTRCQEHSRTLRVESAEVSFILRVPSAAQISTHPQRAFFKLKGNLRLGGFHLYWVDVHIAHFVDDSMK